MKVRKIIGYIILSTLSIILIGFIILLLIKLMELLITNWSIIKPFIISTGMIIGTFLVTAMLIVLIVYLSEDK